MTRNPVNSTLLAAVGYDPSAKLLQVQFKPKKGQEVGDVYEYQNVTALDHANLVGADSVGSHFINVIKKDPARWPHRKLSPEEGQQLAAGGKTVGEQ